MGIKPHKQAKKTYSIHLESGFGYSKQVFNSCSILGTRWIYTTKYHTMIPSYILLTLEYIEIFWGHHRFHYDAKIFFNSHETIKHKCYRVLVYN